MKIRHWNKYQISDFTELLSKFPEGGRVLDLGAWDGATTKAFDDKWDWFGVDVNPVGKGVKHGDAHNLNFPDNHFDLVISIAVFEHLHSPWKAIKEVARVLKKGGYFFGTTAFLEPEHDNSYFHMTQNGVRQIMAEGGLDEHYIKPTENWTVVNSMKLLPFAGRTIPSIKSRLVMGLRRSLIRLRVFLARGQKKKKAAAFLERDYLRYAGSLRFLFQK